jgi:hypothetical protein
MKEIAIVPHPELEVGMELFASITCLRSGGTQTCSLITCEVEPRALANLDGANLLHVLRLGSSRFSLTSLLMHQVKVSTLRRRFADRDLPMLSRSSR